MIEGFVEALRRFQVRGWAIRPAAPSARLRVRVRVNDRVAGTAIADLFRQDLADAKVGDGRHAFVVNVADALPLDRPASVITEVIADDGSVDLIPMLAEVAIETVAVQTRDRPAESSLRGFFSVPSPYEVSGWAYDSARPDHHVTVAIEENGRDLASVSATIFKPDLVQAGIGSGDHGFRFAVPPGARTLQADKIAAFAVSEAGEKTPLNLERPPAAAKPAIVIASPPPVFPGETADKKQLPVIVLGAARSGTSAMAQALTASGVYKGFEEGHFLDLLVPLSQTISQFYKARAEEWSPGRSTLLGAVPQAFITQGLRHIMVEAARHAFPGPRWVDKTPRPSMIAAAPMLLEIWPNARFIYMRRRGLENLDSRLRKFPGLDFEAQCREWALSVQGWYAIVDSLGSAAIEIDQLYMAQNPAQVAVALSGFLDLPASALDRVAQALAFDHPERTGERFGAAAELSDLAWPSGYLETFRSVCGEAMRLAGYSEDAGYFLGGDATSGLVRRGNNI